MYISDDLVPSVNYVIDDSTKRITLLTGTTESDLSGLRGLLAVDYFNIGGISQYSTDYQLVIAGTLSQEPDKESITFGSSIPDESVIVTGTYNYGQATTLFGHTTRSSGLGLLITQQDNNNFDDPVLDVRDGGVFNWNGGVIKTAGSTYFRDGSVVTINDGEMIIENETGGQMLRSFTSSFTVNGFVKIGGAMILYKAPASLTGYQPLYSDLSPQVDGRADYALLLYGGAGSGIVEIRDFLGFGNPNEIGYIDNSTGKFINPVNGSNI